MPQTLNAKRQYYLDIARVIALFAIVLNHAVSRSFAVRHGQMAEFHTIPLSLTLIKAACGIFSNLGVPLFLMITGALILNKPMDTAADVRRFYKHNLLPLFITTEIWLALIYWFKILFDDAYPVLFTEGFFPALWGMVKTMLFLDQVTFASMWYMPMILCLYTTLPLLAMVKSKLSGSKIWLIPVAAVYLYTMVLPAVNVLLAMNGIAPLSTVIREADLFSCFYLYIIAGYLVSRGWLNRLRTASVAILSGLSFVISCAHQIYAYAMPADYTISYTYPLLPVCGALLFDLLRRIAHWFNGLKKPVTYLSRIAFAVYLLHMVVMTSLNTVIRYTGWNPALKMLFMQLASVAGSVVIIALLSKIKPLRKYLFLIK